MNKTINCIILDDEPHAVNLLAKYASKIKLLRVLYAGSDAFKAIEVLDNEEIQLIFIDLQMPELTGAEVMEFFNENHSFVITTAYPEYALKAFKYHVIDFLVKPISFKHFYKSVKKFNQWRLSMQVEKPQEEYILVKADRKHYKILLNSILYVEGMKDYIRIHTKHEKIIILENMKDILRKLPKTQFTRIHRSYIVAQNQIKSIEKKRIQLISGAYLPIGDTYKKYISCFLKNH